MTRDALRGFDEVKSWTGMSECFYGNTINKPQTSMFIGQCTYEINVSLAILLGGESEGCLKACLGLLQHEEGLVWALSLAILLSR